MLGLAILAIIAAYLFLARFITKRMPTRRWKWVVITIFVLIPTGDTAVGYVYFRYLCATEAGNKIYKTAENVEGFYGGVFFPGTDGFTKHGYKFFEDSGYGIKIYRRYTLGADGRVVSEEMQALQSRFGIRLLRIRKPMGIGLNRWEVYDMKTNEVYAMSKYLGYRGGWVYTTPGKILGMSSGASFSCYDEYALDSQGKYTPSDLILQTLHTTTLGDHHGNN